MKAAVLTKPGRTPVFADFDDPVPQVDEELIVVTASALSHVTKSRASGSHHTAPDSLPGVVGIDGVGRTQDGRRVYFVLPEEPFGGMARSIGGPTNRPSCTLAPRSKSAPEISLRGRAIPRSFWDQCRGGGTLGACSLS